MEFILKVLSIEQETHNTKCIKLEKPAGFNFIPGHAAMLSINKSSLVKEVRPFTFISTNDSPYLEFIIKAYPTSYITQAFHALQKGDELIMHAVFGAHRYQGPGVFIAAGTGITPFLAIMRQLEKENNLSNNLLIYSNKKQADIIREAELKHLLGKNALFTLTQENRESYKYGRINQVFLQNHLLQIKQHFYICGPDSFVYDMKKLIFQL